MPPNSVQACQETKFFVPGLLVALGTLPGCPMPATVSSLSVKSLSGSKSSCKTLALWLFGGAAHPWPFPLAGRGKQNMHKGQIARGREGTSIS